MKMSQPFQTFNDNLLTVESVYFIWQFNTINDKKNWAKRTKALQQVVQQFKFSKSGLHQSAASFFWIGLIHKEWNINETLMKLLL